MGEKNQRHTWFFGKWEDPDAVLQSFVEQRDNILAGRDRKAGDRRLKRIHFGGAESARKMDPVQRVCEAETFPGITG